MDETLSAALAVLFVASLVRSAFGFGEALIAVPLLALVMPVEVAAPVAALTSITVAGIILIQDRSEVHTSSASRLVLATIPGVPLGLLLLTSAREPVVKAILAAIIIIFSVYSLLNKHDFRLRTDRSAWLFGFAAGVLGGAYGMNGPPLVIYGSMRGWSPQRFRATLQGYFLPASILVMGGFWFAGLWTATVTRYYLLAMPGVGVAVILGRWMNRRMDGPRFRLYVHAGLILVGVILLIQAM